MEDKIMLEEFLEQKTLYYDKIDYEVIRNSWNILSKHINLPYVIHIIGTNGKGSTGRYLASFLHQSNKNVLHYTSPHIIKFNERIWINGSDSNDDELNFAHHKLLKYLSSDILDKLTYFEYTTLLALFLSDGFDYIVLEAGLGGEFDATNVVTNNLTVVPSIGLDHTEFLGTTIEKIATTKLKSCDKAYILGENIDKKVIKIANLLLKNRIKVEFNDNINLPIGYNLLPNYLQNNLMLALNTMVYLDMPSEKLKIKNINGRMEKIEDNITIDVGHNPLAASAIVNEFIDKKIVLIFNCYKDKKYEEILNIFLPILKKVEIIKCDDERMINIDILVDTCNKLKIKTNIFDIKQLNNKDEYLVFGSFKVIEVFLKSKEINEK